MFKIHKLIFLSLIVFLYTYAEAINYIWDGGGTDSLFQTPENWNPDGIPAGEQSTGDAAVIDPSPKNPTTDSNTNVSFRNFSVGTLVGDANFTMNGGTVTTNYVYLGTGIDRHVNFVMNSGAFVSQRTVYVGNGGSGNIHVLGGAFWWKTGDGSLYELRINGSDADNKSHVQLDGGTMIGANLYIGEYGSMDITYGTITLNNDDTALIVDYVNLGKLTAFGGNGIISYHYDDGARVTHISASCEFIPQDMNRDCIVDYQDLYEFISHWLANDSYTYNTNGIINDEFVVTPKNPLVLNSNKEIMMIEQSDNLLLRFDGGSTGYGTFDAAFYDTINCNNALPINVVSGETGLGIVSGISQSTSYSTKIGNSAMYFSDNKNFAANIPDSIAEFDRNYTNFTVSLWYKPDSDNDADNNNNFLIGKMGITDQRGWQLYRYDDSSRIEFLFFDGPSGSSQSITRTAGGPMANKFTHIAATFAANDAVCLYFDGKQVSSLISNVKSSLNGINNKPLQIGNRGDFSDDSASGIIDDVGIWDSALSAQTIAAIHAMGLFEGLNIRDEDITNLLSAFAEKKKTGINNHIWEYTTNLSVPLGAIGGGSDTCNAFVVLDSEGNGMRMNPCVNLILSDFNQDCIVNFEDFAIIASHWLNN
ncbi:MAG: hypothetical protein A2Y10_09025 [Planctomycetes bacterium GWF2_41_51]|nr:MAG: hypothetical protein A2Y10_09025 [Planctomycetes bacterium GWF2_41_51]HBG26258.1 hypothetical protein [Phycisphaerales bacterium]